MKKNKNNPPTNINFLLFHQALLWYTEPTPPHKLPKFFWLSLKIFPSVLLVIFNLDLEKHIDMILICHHYEFYQQFKQRIIFEWYVVRRDLPTHKLIKNKIVNSTYRQSSVRTSLAYSFGFQKRLLRRHINHNFTPICEIFRNEIIQLNYQRFYTNTKKSSVRRCNGNLTISPHYRSGGRRQVSCGVHWESTQHGEVRLLYSRKLHLENGDGSPLS